MSIASMIRSIKAWFTSLWRSRPDGGSTETETKTTAEKPVSDGQSEVATPPAPVEEQPPTSYLDVGMAYTLEGARGKERPRVEVWPLQPSETRVGIAAGDGRGWKAVTISGFERKQNPQTNATWGGLLVSDLPDTISIVVDNSRIGTITFNGVQRGKFATFCQKVALK